MPDGPQSLLINFIYLVLKLVMWKIFIFDSAFLPDVCNYMVTISVFDKFILKGSMQHAHFKTWHVSIMTFSPLNQIQITHTYLPDCL
jgi:hypothetical protein